jgi:hypothetical protein
VQSYIWAPESHLVLAPSVDPDVDQRAAFQRDVVRQGDDRLVASAGGDVHVRLHLFVLEGVPVRLGVHQRRPQFAGPLDADHTVRASWAVAVRQ